MNAVTKEQPVGTLLTSDSVTQMYARKVMGTGMLGPEKLVGFMKWNPTDKDLDALEIVPFAADKLASCSKTHLLVAVLPLSIREMYRLFRPYFACWPGGTPWYIPHSFTCETGVLEWHLLPLDRKSICMQKEVILSSRIIVCSIIAYHLSVGKALYHGGITCADLQPNGERNLHTLVKFKPSLGIGIDKWPDSVNGLNHKCGECPH